MALAMSLEPWLKAKPEAVNTCIQLNRRKVERLSDPSFIPIVMSTAGNAGIQAATVTVQGIATGTLTFGDLGWRLDKELLAALANGSIVAMVLVMMVLGIAQVTSFDEPVTLALTSGAALISVVVVAAGIGASIPIILERLGIDPAMATG